MSGSLNKAMLIGNLGADPEVRQLPSGEQVANLSVATNETWKDKDTGEKKERVEWHRVSVFGGLVAIIEKWLKKGSKVYLEGQLQTRKYTDKNGVERYSTEVILSKFGGRMVMLGGRDGGMESGPALEKLDEVLF